MTETQLARSPATSGWALLLLVLAAVATTTTNPMLLGALAIAVVASGLLLGGPRRPVHRQAVAVGVLLGLVWLAMTLVLSGTRSGMVLLQRPAWDPATGVALGGPLTLDALLTGLFSGIRVLALFGLVGLAWQAVPGTSWLRFSRRMLGAGADLVAPWCMLGDAVAAGWRRTSIQAAQGWRVPTSVRLAEALRLADASAASATPRGPGTLPVRLARAVLLAALVALPLVTLTGVLATPPLGRLSTLDLALLLALPLLLLGGGLREALRPLTLVATVACLAWLARTWLPGEADLAWSPTLGWPGIPWVGLACVLVLPLITVLLPGGDDDA